MRPAKLDDFIGQEHFLKKNSLFYNSIINHNFESAIFYGPPGTGKTTLARIIASEMDADFVEINASTTGIKELKELIELAQKKFYSLEKKQTYVYIDEFHRWNKLQQDSLLKALEDGVLRFIGSTTENPYFAINNAILSRVPGVYEFHRLAQDETLLLIKRTLQDKQGLGYKKIDYDEEALVLLASLAGGDARIALDKLGYIAENMSKNGKICKELVMEAMQRQTSRFDKEEDRYNLLSALQKSIRGSDPDAAIHYLARLIEGGADEMMIGRRLLVMASEDIGMAYPQAISIVYSCVSATRLIGFPEAMLPLAEAVIFLASCPKSNSAFLAYLAASEDIKTRKIDDVPRHLMDSHYKGAKARGIGIDYKYPHDFGGYIPQQYLPDNIYKEGVQYYNPTENGNEINFKKYLEEIKKIGKSE
jgi:putative ATPase